MKLNHGMIRVLSIVIGLVIGVLLLYMGFQLFSGRFTRASDEAPRDVVVSSISQNSAKIGWATGNDTQGVVEYGTSPTALNFFAPESAAGQTHQMELTLLSPGTAYYFQIRIGENKYDNGGVPWTFTTKSTGDTGSITPTTQPLISPTAATESAVTVTPRPVSTIVIPQASPTPTIAATTCAQTDCVKICQELGKTCGSQDLSKNKCIGKVNLATCTAK